LEPPEQLDQQDQAGQVAPQDRRVHLDRRVRKEIQDHLVHKGLLVRTEIQDRRVSLVQLVLREQDSPDKLATPDQLDRWDL